MKFGKLMRSTIDARMPQSIAELYQIASSTMLQRIDRKERGAETSMAAAPHVRRLLEATFFQAHTLGSNLHQPWALCTLILTSPGP